MRPLTWALKEVDPVGLHRQSGIQAQEILKFKLHHISKNPSYTKKIGRKMPIPSPLANGALCLSSIVNLALPVYITLITTRVFWC